MKQATCPQCGGSDLEEVRQGNGAYVTTLCTTMTENGWECRWYHSCEEPEPCWDIEDVARASIHIMREGAMRVMSMTDRERRDFKQRLLWCSLNFEALLEDCTNEKN